MSHLMIKDIVFIQSIVGLFLIVFLLVLLLAVRAYRLNKICQDALSKCSMLQNHIAAICSTSVNIGKNFDKMDKKIDALADRQEKYELKEPQGKARTYGQAKVLLDKGVELDDIVENCGMSYGEVELIAMVNKLEDTQSQH